MQQYKREVPEFIINKLLLYILMLDKSVSKRNMQEQFQSLKNIVTEYLCNIETGFVSNNSKEFKAYIEERIGKVHFSKAFAVRLKPDSVRFFVKGKEILH